MTPSPTAYSPVRFRRLAIVPVAACLLGACAGPSGSVGGGVIGGSTKVNYALEIDAPADIADSIRTQTFAGRWQKREDFDPFQYDGLVVRLEEETRSILRADGYYDPRVTVDSEPGRVKVTVVPGRRTEVGRVELQLSGPAASDPALAGVLNARFRLAEGNPFQASRWEADKSAVIEALNRQGYLRARVERSHARVDAQRARADLSVTFDSGPRLAFGDVSIEGLGRYDAQVVLDLRTFRPGDPYSADLLAEFQTRLQRSGYFGSSSAIPDLTALQRDPAAVRVPIQVIVAELDRRRADAGIGFSTDEGPRGQVGFEHRDLLGRNIQLQSALIISAKRQRAFANFRTPVDGNNRYRGFGQRIEREDIEGQVSTRSNTYAGIGRQKGDIESFTSVQFQFEQKRLDAGNGLPVEESTNRALVFGHAWGLTRLDSALDPRSGQVINLQLSGAREGLLTDRSFVRLYSRAIRFQPMRISDGVANGTLIGRLELGAVMAGGTDGIPTENLFRTGGVDTIRGYSFLSLGTRRAGATIGGRYLAVGSLEYQHHLSQAYSAAVFVDYGNAGDSREEMSPVAGYGVGVRWRTPVGPIKLDFAYGQADSRLRVHFSVGYSF